MVTIVNYKERLKDDGTSFFVLELQGDMELLQSQKTGAFYATSRKITISSTFDELTCHSLIGKQLPGRIAKVECDPYEYVVEETGEEIVLSHKWSYVPEEITTNTPSQPKLEILTFSGNEVCQEEEIFV